MNWLFRLVCKVRGHKWGKPYRWEEPIGPEALGESIGGRNKLCARCGIIKPIKTRKMKQ